MRLQKNNLNSSCLYLTLRCHAIFAKKKVIKVGGLATLTKKDWIHLIYFLSNTPCNFCKKKKDHRGRWAHSAGKKGLNSPRLCLTLMQHTIFVKKTGHRGGWARCSQKKDWIHLFTI